MEENRLDDLKQAYESIPIPEGLELRVRSSIAQAKKDLRKESFFAMETNRSHKIWKTRRLPPWRPCWRLSSWQIPTPGLPGQWSGSPFWAPSPAWSHSAPMRIPQGKMSAHVDVPQVEGGGKELNQTIQGLYRHHHPTVSRRCKGKRRRRAAECGPELSGSHRQRQSLCASL